MEFEQGLLYHVDGLLRDEAWGDFIISRIPESVRCQLNEKAQKNMLFASNSELRFVMEEETVTIVLRRLPVSGRSGPQESWRSFPAIIRAAMRSVLA